MNNTYCILPFIHIATERNGDYMPCCGSSIPSGYNVAKDNVLDVWNSDYYKKLRQDLLNNVRHPNCKICWQFEDAGITSRRQKNNKKYTQIVEPLPAPIQLDLKTGNICNIKCITCNQFNSSQHEKEVKQWKEKNIKIPLWLEKIDEMASVFNVENIDHIGDNLDVALKSADVLQLQGGEPFASPLTIKILDHCIDNDYLHLELPVITNLTTLTDKILKKITQFPKSTLGISFDHIDPDKFNFIRFPADYNKFIDNFNMLTKTNTGWGFSFTLSIFNALDLESIFDKFAELSKQGRYQYLTIQPVMVPNYFSVIYLEEEQKKSMINSIDKIIEKKYHFINEDSFLWIRQIVSEPNDFNDVVKERTRVLDLYDQTRGTNWEALFPYIVRYE